MALQSDSASSSSQPQQRQRQPHVFEFTKRKRWADILFAELPETVLFVLDSSGRIQYSGVGAYEMLGWEVEELLESDVLELINDDDKKGFQERFQISMNTLRELSCFTRLKCKPATSEEAQGPIQRELLFEVRGRTLYIEDGNESKCHFFMAKPYPSRNMTMLNTFLELKVENERLNKRLADLKTLQDVPQLGTSSLPMSGPSHTQFTPYTFAASSDDALPSPTTYDAFDSRAPRKMNFIHTNVPNVNTRAEEDEDGGKRKKPKKFHSTDKQHVCVTCGRTDSPEWRKGPKGPKTLCNACGLRWAKRSKQNDDALAHGHTTSTSSGRGARSVPVPHAALSVTPTSSAGGSVSPRSQQHSHHDRHAQAQARTAPDPPPMHVPYDSMSTSMSQPQAMSAPEGMYAIDPSQMTEPLLHQGLQQAAPQGYGQYQSSYDQYASWTGSQHHGAYDF
ncbi:hypothetical protein M0805_006499 [Coniferiporia weirii]|nr:hypothetical protein M0805_006499 [Coniferiporia weirii]